MAGKGFIAGLSAYRVWHRHAPPSDAPVPRRSSRPVVWLHATGPAALAPLQVLAAQLSERHPPLDCLLTGTEQEPGPGESPAAIDQFLNHHAVQMVVLAGPVLPPNLIDRARAQGAALFLVDAKHAAAPGRWQLWPGFTRDLLTAFTQIHTRDEAARQALERLSGSAAPIQVSGRLAQVPPAPPCNIFELDALRATLGTRPTWLAYGLPRAEGLTALTAHAQALRRAHRLLMILAPRDAQEGAAFAQQAVALGFACARRANDDEITETTQVYITDAEDPPGLFLRLAQVSYLGGSLTRGEQIPDPLLATALGSALIFGPHAPPSQRAVLDRLRRAGGGRRVAQPADLGEALATLLAPEAGAEAALKAWNMVTEGADATDQLARVLGDWAVLNRKETP